MAPISPVSRKRSTPTDDGASPEEPASKKICVEPILPQTPPPEEILLSANVAETPLFNDTPQELLSRSVVVILEYVGFTGASREALEALCAQVDTYASHFLSQIRSIMSLARRSEATPFDFEYALSKFSLPTASIEPHLKPPVAPPKIHQEVEPLPDEELDSASLRQLLGNELDGESDKASKSYIPTQFPSFPSKHTYKWTEKESARETDPRKIREEAAKQARQAEEALRRLVKVSKAGREKDVKRMAEMDPKSKLRYELWEKAMENLSTRQRNTASKAAEEDDRSMVVNSESQYFRRPAPRKAKAPTQSEG